MVEGQGKGQGLYTVSLPDRALRVCAAAVRRITDLAAAPSPAQANNAVVVDKPTYDKIIKEVPTYKVISQSVLIDRHKGQSSLSLPLPARELTR